MKILIFIMVISNSIDISCEVKEIKDIIDKNEIVNLTDTEVAEFNLKKKRGIINRINIEFAKYLSKDYIFNQDDIVIVSNLFEGYVKLMNSIENKKYKEEFLTPMKFALNLIEKINSYYLYLNETNEKNLLFCILDKNVFEIIELYKNPSKTNTTIDHIRSADIDLFQSDLSATERNVK